jgi:proprotein convertase subtilisin/kexin type 2
MNPELAPGVSRFDIWVATMCRAVAGCAVAVVLLTVCVGCHRGGSSSSPAVFPASPTNVVSTPGDGQNRLTWDAVAGATSYSLYWSTSPGVSRSNGQRIADIALPIMMHSGLVNGTTYYYVITALSAAGESSESREVSAAPIDGPGTMDPLFGDEWHLLNNGQAGGIPGEDINVIPVWNSGLRGEGIRIAVVDDGLDIAHEDLAANIATGLGHNYLDGGSDPTCPALHPFCRHGTAVAGIIGARDLNDLGVRGAAPRVNLVGYNLLQDQTVSNEADAMIRGGPDVQVSNNSWGPPDDGDLHPAGLPWRDAVNTGLIQGRGGLGTVYVWAAGNGALANDNSNYDGYANNRGVIAVCAVGDDGKQALYSEAGANLWVCAPSQEIASGGHGISSTDETGADGYNTGTLPDYADINYTKTFTGTSAAAPQVSGVVALMLQANPNLSWRDVRLVLALTARRNDAADADWSTNGAGVWINHKYGFGVVNAQAAVAAASGWTNVGPQRQYDTALASPQLAIPDNDSAGVSHTINVSGSGIGSLEYIEIIFSAADHPFPGDLQVVLTHVETGTTSRVAEARDCLICTTRYSGWEFGSSRHLGETADGAWTLTVADRVAVDTGTFQSWSLRFYGH